MAIDHTGFTQVGPQSTGNKIDDVGITSGTDTLRRQIVPLQHPLPRLQ